MKLRLIVLFVAIVMLPVSSLEAHHSFGGTYQVDKTITIKGTIVQITLRAPHSFFYVNVPGVDGKPQRWSVEGASASQFASQGVDATAFKVGDPVEVTGNPSRTPNSPRARLIKIVRTTDGKTWGTRAAETVD